MTLDSALIWVGFSIGALAMGVWIILGYNWWRNTTGVLRVALLWLTLYVVASLGMRLFVQTENFSEEEYEPILSPARFILNIAVLGLGLYLAKNSSRINREGEIS